MGPLAPSGPTFRPCRVAQVGTQRGVFAEPDRRRVESSRNRRHPTFEVPATPALPEGDVVSSDRHRPRTASAADDVPGSPPTSPASATDNRIPHTRTGTAWFAVCSAALLCVMLIVFMAQNTRSVEVTFLWTHTSLPVALALLIAAVAATILAVVIGTARIAQLRHLYRRGHGN
jgi:uncharacterized integral membrane protein